VAVVDGRIVENLHIVTARALLAKAAAIAALAGGLRQARLPQTKACASD
jgi:hypothetical protein